MSRLVLVGFACLVAMMGTAQAKPQLGFLFGTDDCVRAKSIFQSNPATCAILFDDDGCEGWQKEVGQGFQALQRRHNNDAEAVMVRQGCVLTAYKRSSGGAGSGRRAVFDARGRENPLIVEELTDDQLEEEISATECYCGTAAAAMAVGCQRVFGGGESADCIVYDDEDCQVEDWDAPLKLARGQSESFSLSQFSYRNTIESVSVRRGCELQVFDGSDFNDDSYVFRAPPNQDLHVTLDEHADSNVRSLDDDINSMRCSCAN